MGNKYCRMVPNNPRQRLVKGQELYRVHIPPNMKISIATTYVMAGLLPRAVIR
jgi:hypothetical protein